MPRTENIDPDDTDDRRRPAKSSPGRLNVLRIVGIVPWVLLFVIITAGGLLFVMSLAKATSAAQEAANGVVFSTIFIGLYIFTRCVEKVVAGVDRIQTNRRRSS